jgi:hypothetical protein
MPFEFKGGPIKKSSLPPLGGDPQLRPFSILTDFFRYFQTTRKEGHALG